MARPIQIQPKFIAIPSSIGPNIFNHYGNIIKQNAFLMHFIFAHGCHSKIDGGWSPHSSFVNHFLSFCSLDFNHFFETVKLKFHPIIFIDFGTQSWTAPCALLLFIWSKPLFRVSTYLLLYGQLDVMIKLISCQVGD